MAWCSLWEEYGNASNAQQTMHKDWQKQLDNERSVEWPKNGLDLPGQLGHDFLYASSMARAYPDVLLSCILWPWPW